MPSTRFGRLQKQKRENSPPHEFDRIESAVTAADHLEERGIPVDHVALGGELTLTIVDRADDADADGLVIAGRKRTGRRAMLVGSTTGDIVLSVEFPVNLTE